MLQVVSVGNYNTEAYEEDDKNVLMDYFNEDDRNASLVVRVSDLLPYLLCTAGACWDWPKHSSQWEHSMANCHTPAVYNWSGSGSLRKSSTLHLPSHGQY
eukprot:scaffold49132_cov77-Cyclotella_meneghiniana.AAC.3